jgi:hypothetical protein
MSLLTKKVIAVPIPAAQSVWPLGARRAATSCTSESRACVKSNHVAKETQHRGSTVPAQVVLTDEANRMLTM